MTQYSPRDLPEVLENIARAIANADGHYVWDKMSKTYRAHYTALAEAALKATPPLYIRPEAIINVGLLPSERKVQVS